MGEGVFIDRIRVVCNYTIHRGSFTLFADEKIGKYEKGDIVRRVNLSELAKVKEEGMTTPILVNRNRIMKKSKKRIRAEEINQFTFDFYKELKQRRSNKDLGDDFRRVQPRGMGKSKKIL